MNFEMKDVLEAVGPPASLIFAAWIFLSFLGQRYTAAYERFRSLAEEYRQDRDGRANAARHRQVGKEIALYRRRCDLMRWATTSGLISAMLFLGTILCGLSDVVFGGSQWVAALGALLAAVGLVLVIVAAGIVFAENVAIRHALNQEVEDLPDLAAATRAT